MPLEQEAQPDARPVSAGVSSFVPPHPGSAQMPQWNAAELIEAPVFTWRNLLAMVGPGLVMGAAAIGGGEWLSGPLVTAKYGGALLWLCTLSILGQVLYNIEISRYTLYTGEPIFTGKFRTLPGPFFWVGVYILLDFGSAFPYLAANAATPVQTVILGELPSPDTVPAHWYMNKAIATAILLLAMVPLLVGGKIFNSLKVVMSLKLVLVLGFLSILAIFYSHSTTWKEILSGFVKFGNVPVKRGEDLNGNGILDPGEDWDGDGNLDVVEPVLERNEKGKVVRWEDVDGDTYLDGNNVENVFVALFTRGEFPKIDLSLVALITAMAAIAGNGGLTNAPISNFVRDQGWGMGHHVGAIPSMIGGRGIQLSQVGSVFEVTQQSLRRWQHWMRHIRRDQLLVWMGACFVGIALPSMLSVEFLRRGTDAGDWNAASMTAAGVATQVTAPAPDVLAARWGLDRILSGPNFGKLFWAMTLLCGFLVLATSTISTIDGFIRRWVDVFWTASANYWKAHPSSIKYAYFCTLMCYATFGITMLWLQQPTTLLKISTIFYNYALGVSCWHTLAVNVILLPREIRPGWLTRCGLLTAGAYFAGMGTVATFQQLGYFN
ncbi:MAG: Nramp family divalent metal transporter [Pirellulaceae bacterium]